MDQCRCQYLCVGRRVCLGHTIRPVGSVAMRAGGIGKGGQCVLLRGNDGTTLILSPQEPEKLLAVLHQQVVDRR